MQRCKLSDARFDSTRSMAEVVSELSMFSKTTPFCFHNQGQETHSSMV